MSTAVGRIYREGTQARNRGLFDDSGKIGTGRVYRVGDQAWWRALDCNSKTIIGQTTRTGDQVRTRSLYQSCSGGVTSCEECNFPISTMQMVISGVRDFGIFAYSRMNGTWTLANSATGSGRTVWNATRAVDPLNMYVACDSLIWKLYLDGFVFQNLGAVLNCIGPQGTYRFRGPSNEIITVVIT